MDVAAAKLLVPVQNCYIWHEVQTDRIRISYQLGDRRQSYSVAVQDDMDLACRTVLQWAWRQHTDATGEEPAEAAWMK